jgi:hypothetical protein
MGPPLFARLILKYDQRTAFNYHQRKNVEQPPSAVPKWHRPLACVPRGLEACACILQKDLRMRILLPKTEN